MHRLSSLHPSLNHATFFKCTRWLVEETTDSIACPYHYSCESIYPGQDYPPIVDLFALLFAAASYLSAATFTAFRFKNRESKKRRYLVPSGPLALPLMLLILGRGRKINTIFPISYVGPALLQLVYISALAFENQPEKSVKYAVIEASTISGILHAGLYLDSVIMPYYTGLDALMRSAFSGECEACVCRNDEMVVGGEVVMYRGWSNTMLVVVCTLCSRMIFRILGDGERSLLIKMVLEFASWVLIASDCVHLMIFLPQGGIMKVGGYGGICVLILMNVLRKVCIFWRWLEANYKIQRIASEEHNV